MNLRQIRDQIENKSDKHSARIEDYDLHIKSTVQTYELKVHLLLFVR